MTIATDVVMQRGLCVCVCVLGTSVSTAETDEPIEMPLGFYRLALHKENYYNVLDSVHTGST